VRTDGRWDLLAGEREPTPIWDGLPMPALVGSAQAGNAATALTALAELRDRLPVARAAVEAGLSSVALAGRFQRMHARGNDWILDVAHNPAAASVLAASLQATPVHGRTIAVCGMLADKDVPAVLTALRGRVDRWIAATTAGERGLADRELARRARAVGIEMLEGGGIAAALGVASGMCRAGDRVVVFGSFHTVGPALAALAERGRAMSPSSL
jgi:dihydrofolate synthase/folylpolyglutamate synthase